MLAMTFTANMGTIQSASAASAGDRVTDFNGDGFEDLAIGVYREDIGTNNAITDAGSVNVIHGSEIGLSALIYSGSGTGLANQEWTQSTPGVLSAAKAGERFGQSVAAGDFDNDGYSDMVVGVPSETVAGLCCNVGGVNVIYGSSGGLSTTASVTNQVINQNSANVQGVAAADDDFGQSVTVGDFNNDGYDDVAVGAPGEPVTTSSGTFDNAGVVNVIYGSSQGLSATVVSGTGLADQIWSQNTKDIDGIPAQNDFFGFSLATGDFNDDGYDDLAIGMRGEGPSDPKFLGPGAVSIIYGSPTGLSATFVADQLFQEGKDGVDDGCCLTGIYNDVGYSLASGDFDNDGYDDLIIGNPELNGHGGGVYIIFGTASGLSATTRADQFFSGGVLGPNGLEGEERERLGVSLTAGDFNGDGYDDVGIGAAGALLPEGTVGESDGGSVTVIYGSSSGLSLTFVPDQFWHQNSPSIEEVGIEAEQFGYAITAGDYNDDNYADLAIGVIKEDVNHDTIDSAGVVQIIYGSSDGLSATGANDASGRSDQVWFQNSPDVKGVSEVDDFFGSALG
jgi:hypothetical protein